MVSSWLSNWQPLAWAQQVPHPQELRPIQLHARSKRPLRLQRPKMPSQTAETKAFSNLTTMGFRTQSPNPKQAQRNMLPATTARLPRPKHACPHEQSEICLWPALVCPSFALALALALLPRGLLRPTLHPTPDCSLAVSLLTLVAQGEEDRMMPISVVVGEPKVSGPKIERAGRATTGKC